MRKGIIIAGLALLVFLMWIFWPLFQKVAPTATKVLLHSAPTLQETNGRTNILLLGIGGGSHEGPNLTDTIMLASIDAKNGKVTLISIPRDLWVSDLQEKINAAYADGQDETPARGLILAKSIVGKITGQPIHYGFRIDFQGFVKAINEVGGVDVVVDRTLDDYQYPIEGKEDESCGHTDVEIKDYSKNASDSSALDFFPCRYKHLHFDAGKQHMDGETALEFVRSRHALGIEGSDFARSARQQKVIEGFREKIFSLQTIFNPNRLANLYSILQSSIDTDIKQEEVGLFLRLAPKLRSAKIENAVIDYGDTVAGRAGLLINPPISAIYSFASVLIPRIGDGNFSEIQSYVACEITKGGCKVSDNPVTSGEGQ